MKTQPALALLLIVLVTTVAIPRRTVAADPFDINVILPLTGGGAFLGKSEQISLGVAEERINSAGGISGRPVHFVIQDDETNAQTAVQLLNGVLGEEPGSRHGFDANGYLRSHGAAREGWPCVMVLLERVPSRTRRRLGILLGHFLRRLDGRYRALYARTGLA